MLVVVAGRVMMVKGVGGNGCGVIFFPSFFLFLSVSILFGEGGW